MSKVRRRILSTGERTIADAEEQPEGDAVGERGRAVCRRTERAGTVSGAQRRHRRRHGVRVRSLVVRQRGGVEVRGGEAAEAASVPADLRAQAHK